MPETTAATARPREPANTTVVTAETDPAMRELGRRLAGALRPGDLVLLSGPLGAGKTTLTQGVGDGLGVRGPVASPTFVVTRVHPSLRGGPALVHVDAYRLGTEEEVDDLDLESGLDDSVTVVEWGAGVAEGLAEDRLHISIERRPDDVRAVRLTGVGARWSGALPGAQQAGGPCCC